MAAHFSKLYIKIVVHNVLYDLNNCVCWSSIIFLVLFVEFVAKIFRKQFAFVRC